MGVGSRLFSRFGLGGGLVSVLLTACGAPGVGPPSPPAVHPIPTSIPTSAPSAAPSPSARPTSTGTGYPTVRPVQPVPKVRPPGFTEPPVGRGLERYSTQQVQWRDCPEVLGQCAAVLAPLDYAHPDGPAITLAVRKVPATAQPRLGTLFLNPGGPGGSGWDFVTWFESSGLGQYDILGWDARGVQRSTPVRCEMGAFTRLADADGSPDSPAELKRLLDAARTAGTSCLARSGPLLEHVSTEETARDLDLLRGLVGDPKLTYYGLSYGTALGSLFATMFPDRVGRMVLDSAVTFDERALWTATYGFERQLHAFATDCAATPPCPLGFSADEVLRRIGQLLSDLEAKPLPVGDRSLTQTEAARAIVAELYRPRAEWFRLRTALHSAIEQRFGTALLALADEELQRKPDATLPDHLAAFSAIACLDSSDDSVEEQLAVARQEAARSPILGPYRGLNIGCAVWPVASRPPPAVGGTVAPMVIVGTTGDPITTHEYAVATSQRFPGSVLLTLEGHGHGAYRQSPCIREQVVSYLVAGTLPPQGARCTS